jgi:hypothetical protein
MDIDHSTMQENLVFQLFISCVCMLCAFGIDWGVPSNRQNTSSVGTADDGLVADYFSRLNPFRNVCAGFFARKQTETETRLIRKPICYFTGWLGKRPSGWRDILVGVPFIGANSRKSYTFAVCL